MFHVTFIFGDELVILNDIILKGERIVIPYRVQRDIFEKVYGTQIGIKGCARRD